MFWMLAQFVERCCGRRTPAAATGGFGGQKLDRAVHADGPDLVHLG